MRDEQTKINSFLIQPPLSEPKGIWTADVNNDGKIDAQDAYFVINKLL